MKELSYLRALFAVALRRNPLLYVSFGLAVLSVCIEIGAMTILMPLAIVASGAQAPSNFPVARLMSAVGLGSDGKTLFLLFIGLMGLRVVTNFFAQALTVHVGRQLISQLSAGTFDALVHRMPVSEIEQKSVGYFVTLAGDEANRAGNLIIFVIQLISLQLLGALYFLTIAHFSLLVASVVAVFLLTTALSLYKAFEISHRLGVRQIAQSQAMNNVFIDALNGLRSIRSFGAESYVTESYSRQIRNYGRTLTLIDVTSLASRAGPALLLLAIATVAALAMRPTGPSGETGLPFIFMVLVLLMRFFPIAGQTLSGALRVVSEARSGRDVTGFLEKYSSKSWTPGADAELDHIEKIRGSNIHFSYAVDKPVLTGLDIELRKGCSYAIAGVSGSGKSTLLDLLLGFYQPAKGELTFNGRSLKELSTAALRKKVVFVTQDTAIFNDTVANNLAMGLEVIHDELVTACRIAAIDDFVGGMSDGYQTVLAYRGGNLSGGQRQRLGIARAVLRKPDVLLLDESTSALDAETREKVLANLLNEFKDRILVFVTHDSHVMARVDHVLDMSAINNTRQPVGQGNSQS